VPGAAVGVLREGMVTAAYHGVADVTTGEPVRAETRFSVGSLTKSMVATVVARLAEAGRLSLDDPVATHVPELRGRGWVDSATVRDLLANRAGLPLRAALEFGFAERNDEDEDALSRLAADIPAGVRAADFWSYTNVGWCLLGRVIEAATGTAWEDAMRRLLFARAGMNQTTSATNGIPKQRASGHEVTADGPG
jgi:D-alanyl-D-alanine carboxypeptidase